MSERPFRERVHKMMSGELPAPPIGDLIGMRPTEVSTDYAVFEMEAGRKHANPMGTLHGGVLCDIADAAMSMAWASELGEGETFTTLELKMNFLKPVWETKIRAEGRVIRRGKTIGLAQCDLRDGNGDLVAYAVGTFMTLRGEQAKGR